MPKGKGRIKGFKGRIAGLQANKLKSDVSPRDRTSLANISIGVV
jgi:hypothetical protein